MPTRQLESAGPFPEPFLACLGDLRPRFIPKGRVGRGYRAISRNGKVLLAGDVPVDELAGRVALVRLQTWHKAILPGEPAEPYGVLLCVRCLGHEAQFPTHEMALGSNCEDAFDWSVDVGGKTRLFSRTTRSL